MKNILFFNTYHIGDIFWPLSFIKNIIENNPEYNFFYWIPQGHAFYKNLNIKFANNINVNNLAAVNFKVISHFDDVTAINTWVRSCWEDPEFKDIQVRECNIYDKHTAFKRVCEKLNLKFTLDINNIIYELPETDITPFKEWNDNHKDNKKIFYFNYLGQSGQPTSLVSHQEHEYVINALADKYPQHYIIIPDGTNICRDNIINCQNAFNINRDITCENVIKMHHITNYCDYVIYSATGACFVALNRQCLSVNNKKIYLYSGQSRIYSEEIDMVASKTIGKNLFYTAIDCHGIEGVLNNLYNVITD